MFDPPNGAMTQVGREQARVDWGDGPPVEPFKRLTNDLVRRVHLVRPQEVPQEVMPHGWSYQGTGW